MTILGVDVTTTATLIATISRIDRFASPRREAALQVEESYSSEVAD